MGAIQKHRGEKNILSSLRVKLFMVAVLCYHSLVCIPQPYVGGISREEKIECLLTIANNCVGVTENPRGSNWGKDVKAFLSYVNLDIPAPWCAAFTAYCFANVGCDVYHPTSGLVALWSRGEWAKYVVADSRKEGRIFASEIQAGDVFTIYYSSLKRDGHIGIVLRVEGLNLITIEGNTNNDGSRDGYGVFVRKRSVNSISKIIRLL